MSAIKKMLKEIESLKPMPQIAHRIMEIMENPNSSLTDVADLVIYDPSLTANILKISNSAFYGLPKKIDTVKDAIRMIGIDQIIDLVILKSGSENLKNKQEGYGLHEGELWKYAVSSALIAKEVAIRKQSGNTHLIFTAALLKDIGKIILDRYILDSFEKINDLVSSGNVSFGEAEKKILGISHAEVGGIIAKMWKFSPKMVSMITHHHLPDKTFMNDPDIAIIYLSDIICIMMGISGGADGLSYRFHKKVFDFLNIGPIELQEIIASFGENMQKVEDLVGAIDK